MVGRLFLGVFQMAGKAFASLVGWVLFAVGLSAGLLAGCSTRGEPSPDSRYTYKRMIVPVTWGEREFMPRWPVADTYREAARRLRWVRAGGRMMNGPLPTLRPSLDLHATVAAGLAPIERDDLVEIYSSGVDEANLDTQANTAVVVRIVCKRGDRLCVHAVMSRLSSADSQVIGAITPREWAGVPRQAR
jgi:hypothetical protein